MESPKTSRRDQRKVLGVIGVQIHSLASLCDQRKVKQANLEYAVTLSPQFLILTC